MARRSSPPSLVSHRLVAQRLAHATDATPGEVVARLGAIQAQDYAGCRWAVALRLRATVATSAPTVTPTEAAIDRALAEGAILRTHALRWTWQLVARADIRWLVAFAAPRLYARNARRLAELGVDAPTRAASQRVFARALADGAHLTRAELGSALTRAKIPDAPERLSYLLSCAELDGLLCSGAPRGAAVTYALLDRRAPDARPALRRDDAIAELARRYFASRGPATVADFAWWAGVTTTEARAATDAVATTLVADTIDDTPTWRAARTAPAIASPSAYLIPAFDEYLIAYRDRDAILDPAFARRVNAGGGMLDPCVVVDGRVIGVWRRELARASVAVSISLFEDAPPRVARALTAAAARYGAYLGREVELAIGAHTAAPRARRV
ncbi:MAG: winged helix DNA-binding domain-containing protein [Deltaproteobacteria bacterium]|nr:winged helix DNA-binding domain-containing protein [Deltaproteobacteria bacterium]